ncbi:MAG: DUF4062 domain-containing protein [Treponema sp.]|jgi:hypothetical protein|nr:DUF4062 domain-containing protein [Treponema sp.]
MIRKYHIYLSSTQDDLRVERVAVARTIWELGHIPVIPEALDPVDPIGAAIMHKNIAEADYCIVLTAYRSGASSSGEEGKSPVETDYETAVQSGVPVIGLLIGAKARWKASKKDTGPADIAALEAFKQKLQAHSHVFWNNAEDLRYKTREILTREIFLNPRNGWIPGDTAGGPSAAAVMGRLVAANEELRRHLLVQADPVRREEQVKHALGILSANKVSLSFFYTSGETWENTISSGYLRLFKLLAPELYTGKTTSEISRFLGSVLNPDLSRTVRRDYPIPSNTVKKLLADFNLLKLTGCSSGGEDEVWELSSFGREVFALYRFRRLEQALPPEGAIDLPLPEEEDAQ